VRSGHDVVRGARVVEARDHIDDESHLPADGQYSPDQAVAVRRAGPRRRHEVMHLRNAAGGHEARDQDVRVREVELLRAPAVALGGDSEVAPAVGIQD
jgi:hypothetical protein